MELNRDIHDLPHLKRLTYSTRSLLIGMVYQISSAVICNLPLKLCKIVHFGIFIFWFSIRICLNSCCFNKSARLLRTVRMIWVRYSEDPLTITITITSE